MLRFAVDALFDAVLLAEPERPVEPERLVEPERVEPEAREPADPELPVPVARDAVERPVVPERFFAPAPDFAVPDARDAVERPVVPVERDAVERPVVPERLFVPAPDFAVPDARDAVERPVVPELFAAPAFDAPDARDAVDLPADDLEAEPAPAPLRADVLREAVPDVDAFFFVVPDEVVLFLGNCVPPSAGFLVNVASATCRGNPPKRAVETARATPVATRRHG